MDPKAAMGSSKLKSTTLNNNEKVIKSYPYGGYGCSWPLRNYTCSFCKREFKSAQALGGHMNVHRRDRAARFMSPPPPPPPSASLSWLHSYEIPSPNPNPNPSGLLTPLSSSSSSSSPLAARTSIYTHQYSLVSLSLSCLSPSTLPCSVDLGNFKSGFSSKDGEGQAMKLDLELGLKKDTKVDDDDDDHDLDLELRLGSEKP